MTSMTLPAISKLQAMMQRFVTKQLQVSIPGLEITVVEDKGRRQLRVVQGENVLHVRPTLKGAECLANTLGLQAAASVLVMAIFGTAD